MDEPNFEIYAVLSAWQTNLILWVILLIFLLSAYLIASYLVGKYLRRSQVIVMTGLMLWFSALIVIEINLAMQFMIDMRELAFFGYTALRKATAFKWLVSVGCAIAPLACIRFMVHMRHPRRADDMNTPRGAQRRNDM
ncbi:MAG: hypothetical protein HRT77_00480 [Halioglobus sp.]|nr:hypothetical protein [Halioglobus sp.]